MTITEAQVAIFPLYLDCYSMASDELLYYPGKCPNISYSSNENPMNVYRNNKSLTLASLGRQMSSASGKLCQSYWSLAAVKVQHHFHISNTKNI
jgi:hypothetical protein